MPRFLLAGGLDHERAAFAATLAQEWNDVPLDLVRWHQPMYELDPERLEAMDTLIEEGSWVVHSNSFTKRQARAVRFATHVVVIGFHESQLDDQDRAPVEPERSRQRVVQHLSGSYAARYFFVDNIHDPDQNSFAQLGNLLGAQRSRRSTYIRELRRQAWHEQHKNPSRFEGFNF